MTYEISYVSLRVICLNKLKIFLRDPPLFYELQSSGLTWNELTHLSPLRIVKEVQNESYPRKRSQSSDESLTVLRYVKFYYVFHNQEYFQGNSIHQFQHHEGYKQG